jgi:dihydroorotase
MRLDYLIRNGTVIDASNGTYGLYDVGIMDGVIKGVYEPGTFEGETSHDLDAVDCYVTPGWIDLHAHIFEAVSNMGLKPDVVGVLQGVTTVVDAGSAGEGNFQSFVSQSILNNKSQVLAWLNIASPGLAEGRSELADLTRLDIGKAANRIEEYREFIIGIKARISGSVVKQNGITPLKIAKTLAREAGLPVMVHIGNAPPQLGEVLNLLEQGDVVTHAFHGKPGGILDPTGKLIPEAVQALERGVLFDVGHGSSSFSFETMKKAKASGVDPYSISTDIYKKNKEDGPIYSLALTMTKFLALGYSLEQIIAWTTWAPAKILRRAEDIGTLKVGSIADLTILKIVEHPVKLMDSEQQMIEYDRYIQPQYTIKSGEMHLCI